MAKAPTDKTPHLRVVSDSTKKRAPAKTGGGTGGGGKGGRPPHQVTAASRGLVAALKGTGFTDQGVANAMGLSLNTLKVHYPDDLAQGKERAQAKVAATLFQIATTPTHPRCVTAAIFIAKAQMGWRDHSPEADTAEDGDAAFTIGIGEKRGA